MNLFSKDFTRYLNLAVLIAVLLLCLFALLRGRNAIGGRNQWDFTAHYFSAKAFQAGLNPYDNQAVNSVTTKPYVIPIEVTYPYHPYTLHYFRLFTWLPYPRALLVYMLYHLVLVLILPAVWQAFFQEPFNIFLLLIQLLFSFNSTLFLALTAGNPAVFEAFVIWIALLAFIKDLPWLFLFFIVIISFFKGTPIVLTLMVFLLPAKWKNAIPFVTMLTISLMIWLSPLLFSSKIFHDFWAYSSNVREFGISNPSSFAMIYQVFLEHAWFHNRMRNLIYSAWVLTVGFTYLWTIRKLSWNRSRVEMAFLTLLTYAIIVPRFKDYAYLQLIPVAYFLATKNPALLFSTLFALFIPAITIKLPNLVSQYHPLIAAVVNWAYLVAILAHNHPTFPKNGALVSAVRNP